MTQCMYKQAVRVLGLNYVASNKTITCDACDESKQLESVNKASPTHTSINKVYVATGIFLQIP